MNDRTFQAKDAHRLEDPDRLTWLPPSDVVKAMQLRKDMTVADIGAGTGYFAIPIAREIGNGGKVLAVDFQNGMLDLMRRKLKGKGMPGNIELVRGEATETTLESGSCDVVLLANVWHELDDHETVIKEVLRALHPRGRIAILDWRSDVTQPPGPPLAHRIPAERVAALLKEHQWNNAAIAHIGKFSYLVQAER